MKKLNNFIKNNIITDNLIVVEPITNDLTNADSIISDYFKFDFKQSDHKNNKLIKCHNIKLLTQYIDNELNPISQIFKKRQGTKKINGIIHEQNQQRIMLTAPMGSGKTRAMLNILSKRYSKYQLSKIVIIFPNIINIDQIKNEYGHLHIQCLHGKSKTKFNKLNGMVITTWDSFLTKIPENHKIDILVRDEVHMFNNSNSFRSKTISDVVLRLDGIPNIIDITATPTNNYAGFYNHVYQFEYADISLNKSNNVKLNIINDKSMDKINNNIINKIKNNRDYLHVILRDHGVKNDELMNTINTNVNDITISTLSVENKHNNETYNTIIIDNSIDVDVIITTSLFANGININNTDKTMYHVIDKINVKSIVQLYGRTRNDKSTVINVYRPFHRHSDNIQYVSFNKIYDNSINHIYRLFDMINDKSKLYQNKPKLNKLDINPMDGVYKNDAYVKLERLIENKSIIPTNDIPGEYIINYHVVYELATDRYLCSMHIDEYALTFAEYIPIENITIADELTEKIIIKKNNDFVSHITKVKHQVTADAFHGTVETSENTNDCYAQSKVNQYKRNKKHYKNFNNKQQSMLLFDSKLRDILDIRVEYNYLGKNNIAISPEHYLLLSYLKNEFYTKKIYTKHHIIQLYNKFKYNSDNNVSFTYFNKILNNLCLKTSIGNGEYTIKIYSYRDITKVINEYMVKNKIDIKFDNKQIIKYCDLMSKLI